MRRDSSNWQWSGAKYAYDHEIAVSEWGTEYPGPTIGPAYGLGVTSSSIASTVAGYMAQSHYSYDKYVTKFFCVKYLSANPYLTTNSLDIS